MLPRASRLTSSADFSRLYKKGKRVATLHLQIFFLPRNQNTSRFGFVISKKNATRIVARNRIKRILRAMIRETKSGNIMPVDAIITGKSGISNLRPAQIRQELTELLKKAKV